MLSEPVIHLQLALHLGIFDLISVKELTALFNSLWPSDAVGWHRSCVNIGSGNACCLTEPIHYLNQCGLPISDILWPLPESNFTVNAWITFYLFVLFFYFLLFFFWMSELLFWTTNLKILVLKLLWLFPGTNGFIHWSQNKIVMNWCKKDVTPLLMHWSYVFFAWTHQYVPFPEHNFLRFLTTQVQVSQGKKYIIQTGSWSFGC